MGVLDPSIIGVGVLDPFIIGGVLDPSVIGWVLAGLADVSPSSGSITLM